jgi:hypothetical protein
MMMMAPVLTPHGLLTLRQTGDALALDPEQGSRLEKAFARGAGHGLLWLGANEVGMALPPVLSYWREFGARYVTALCALPGIGEGGSEPGETEMCFAHARSQGFMHVGAPGFCFAEPTLDDLLSEPIVAALMKADGVDPAALKVAIREQAGLWRRPLGIPNNPCE